jgi:hypothetical protein
MWKTATGKENFIPFRQISTLHVSERPTETNQGLLRSFQPAATCALNPHVSRVHHLCAHFARYVCRDCIS